MQILVKITNLPEGSNAGPTFNIIPNIGVASPATANINDLTGDGVIVTVDNDVTIVTLESTGLCTNLVSVNFYDNYLCLTILDGLGNYYSFQQTNVIFTDGQPSSYEYSIPFEVPVQLEITWNPSEERWEAISVPEVGDPVVIAYLPGESSAGSSGWVNLEIEDLPFIIYCTTQGQCCNCVSILYNTSLTREGTYIDCNGEEQPWIIAEASPIDFATSVCTPTPQSVTYSTDEGLLVSLYGSCPCPSICASFDGGNGALGDPFSVNLTLPPFASDAIRDGKPVYYSAPPPIGESGFEFYIRWVAANDRWELRTDLDDASSIYAFLETSGLYPPIGTSVEWQCGLLPNDSCEKFAYGLLVTSYGLCE